MESGGYREGPALSRTDLIVALDLPGHQQALALARQVRPWVSMVKVGLEGYTAHGPRLVRDLVEDGFAVFLDLKLHDIPRTAAAAARQASALGVSLLTVHAAGGAAMVEATRQEAAPTTKIIAVTMLTSMGEEDVEVWRSSADLAQLVHGLGEQALRNGADGLVCSGLELAALRPLGGLRVVPGVRPVASGGGSTDQKRVVRPEQAAADGADWVVVGRPVYQAVDAGAAAQQIAASLA